MIILIGQILLMMHKAGSLSNTDLFIDKAVLERTWLYISIAGAGFALSMLIKFMTWFGMAGDLFKKFYIAEIAQVGFMIAFVMAAYNKMSIVKTQIYAEEGTEIWRRIFKNK